MVNVANRVIDRDCYILGVSNYKKYKMDLTNKTDCIISCGVNGHYPSGVERLERSLIYEGWGGQMRFWKNEYPEGCPPHGGDHQYNFKVYAFEEMFKAGKKIVIWADASLWAVKNPMPIFDYVNEHGLYFFKSGYSLAETATDKLCRYANVMREDLTEVSEFATGLVGINIDNPLGNEFFQRWKQSMVDGMFGGNRFHDTEDSNHPLFKFSRQDQSSASMILHQMGVKTCGETMDFQAYKGTGHNPEKILFFIGGLG